MRWRIDGSVSKSENSQMAKHKLPTERIEQIVSIALTMAEKHGLQHVTRERIAKQSDVSEALVSYHLGTMGNLRRRLVREAIKRPCLKVLAQALAAGDSHAQKAPDELKKKALASLA
jgi:AcrR family transcriptional regulator